MVMLQTHSLKENQTTPRRAWMKKSLGFVVLILFICSMSIDLCSSENTKAYNNDKFGFSIDYPVQWNQANVTGGNIIILFTAGAINRNLQVLFDEGGETGGMAALERLASILQNHKVFKAEWREVNGRRSYFQVVEWSSIIGNNRAVRLMVPHEDYYFLVMGVCPAGEFGELSPLLEGCVLSFKINE